jgi:hypothetical protein
MEILYQGIRITDEVYCTVCLQNLYATTTNHGKGAEQNGECYNSASNRMGKMATEVDKEITWKDDSLWRLEQ